jgi:hypothetical protein
MLCPLSLSHAHFHSVCLSLSHSFTHRHSFASSRPVPSDVSGAYPHFLEVDQIDFKKPVDIGDLVRLRSRGE